MFHVIAPNPDDALYLGRSLLDEVGAVENSRNGRVLVAPAPVVTEYTDPCDRVSRSALRDANPFFHLFEALWMLAGRNDVATVARYAKRMEEFSDDGLTLNGAYGHRWRWHFGIDQLLDIISQLRANLATRRAVLTMWDPRTDIALGAAGGKDVPCNTQAYFRVREEEGFAGAKFNVLDMTVCCRSNDIVWGAYGANVVHFSMMQEFVARAVGVAVGKYYQMSNNYHMYIDRPDAEKLTADALRDELPAVNRRAALTAAVPLFAGPESHDMFLEDTADFFRLGTEQTFITSFFRSVVAPMARAHQAHKEGRTLDALEILGDSAVDWHVAGYEWLGRRHAKQLATQEVR